jgi:hypothetical protein
LDVVVEQSLNREKKQVVYTTTKMASPNGLSSVLLAVVFDLPAVVEPPLARGERRERRGQVIMGEMRGESGR